MPKFRFHTKSCNESIAVTDAKNIQEAVNIFAKIKVLNVNNFLDLYEVTQIQN